MDFCQGMLSRLAHKQRNPIPLCNPSNPKYPQFNLTRQSNVPSTIRLNSKGVRRNTNTKSKIKQAHNYYQKNESKPNISFQTQNGSHDSPYHKNTANNGINMKIQNLRNKSRTAHDNKILTDSIIQQLSEEKISMRNLLNKQKIQKSITVDSSHNISKLKIQLNDQSQLWDSRIKNSEVMGQNKRDSRLMNGNRRNSETKIVQKSSFHENIDRKHGRQTYQELLAQNKKLKDFIKYEYKPIKRSYDQLVREQEDRDFLISQLEWKVRKLAGQLKAKNKI